MTKRSSILDIAPAPQNRTCQMCKHFSSYSIPATFEDPGDEGWDCNEWGGIPEDQQDDVEDGNVEAARECPRFEYNPNWNRPEREEPVSFREPTEAEQQAWAYQDAVANGWVDPETGEPTDEFFRASDEAYDASR